MSQKRVKRKSGPRKEIFKALRESGEYHKMNHRNGTTVFLNFNKRFLLGKPYKNFDYQKEFQRFSSNLLTNLREKMKENSSTET